MATPEISRGFPGQFPLDPERVIGSFDDIRKDPEHTLLHVEVDRMEADNPRLYDFLCSQVHTMEEWEMDSYTEATLTTYKLIREASVAEGVLPALTVEGMVTLLTRIIDALREAAEVRPVGAMSKIVRDVFAAELESEPAVYAAVKRLAEYRINQDAYYAGASMVVAGLRLAIAERN